jgi:ABC-type antimicrobial peptide transport system permease subunit
MATGGVAVGLAVSFVAAKSLGTFIYGITAYDSFSYVVVPVATLAAAAIAALVPARRAARVDPLTALRG